MTAVRLVAVSAPVVPGLQTAEDLVVYCARVSSPQNQLDVATAPRLLRYCLRKGHWSVFETVSATLEITTSRAIAAQILRHRSFTFQEFSQRYAVVPHEYENVEPRRQDEKNRQASHNDLPKEVKDWWYQTQLDLGAAAWLAYGEALERGIARETARFLLPLSTTTRLYMTGNLRSWLFYTQTRLTPETQQEHREVALAAWGVLSEVFPVTFKAMAEQNHE